MSSESYRFFVLLAGSLALACAGDDGSGASTAHTSSSTTSSADSSGESESGEEDETTGTNEPIVTVLTMNLQNAAINPTDVDVRTQAVIDEILAAEPDLVALQEVTETGTIENRAAVIAEATGYEWTWEPTHNVPTFDEGIAVLSRWPFVWNEATALPHPELAGLLNRAVLGVRAEAPVGELQLFCTHMTIEEDPAIKADQATTALDFMAANPSTLAGFFAGDLNAVPDDLAMQVLRGDAEHMGQSGDLRDAWTEINGDAPGLTFPSDAPDKRIDYVYVVPGTESGATPESCQLVLTDAVDGVRPSDHFGVLCRFRLS